MDAKKHFSQRMSDFPGAPAEIGYVIYSSRIWERFLELVPPQSSTVLDVGCGGGTLLRCLSDFGYHQLTGTDLHHSIQPSFLDPSKYQFLELDMMKKAPPAASFDGALSTMVIEHVPDDHLFVRHIAEAIKPGGYLMITSVLKQPWAWYFYRNEAGETVLESTHLREYLEKETYLALFEGLEIIEVQITPIRYPLIDPLLKWLYKLSGIKALVQLEKGFFASLRRLRIPIPGYYAIEVIARKAA